MLRRAAGGEAAHYDWPDFDERSASTLCYTSGTTGNPKGVLYSHRSAMLVAMQFAPFVAMGAPNGAQQTMMPMAPMFHGNAWQFPYLAPMVGARLVLPGRNYEPDKLYELLEGERVTLTCGVPTFWLILTEWLQRTGKTFSTLRTSLSSGSAPPRSLIETHGARLRRAADAGLGHDRGAGRQRRDDGAGRGRAALRAAHRPAHEVRAARSSATAIASSTTRARNCRTTAWPSATCASRRHGCPTATSRARAAARWTSRAG